MHNATSDPSLSLEGAGYNFVTYSVVKVFTHCHWLPAMACKVSLSPSANRSQKKCARLAMDEPRHACPARQAVASSPGLLSGIQSVARHTGARICPLEICRRCGGKWQAIASKMTTSGFQASESSVSTSCNEKTTCIEETLSKTTGVPCCLLRLQKSHDPSSRAGLGPSGP